MIWLWSSEHIDFYLAKVAELAGEQFNAEAFLCALTGISSIEEAKELVLTHPIRFQSDSYEVIEAHCKELDEDTVATLMAFVQSLPVELIPVPPGEYDYDVREWIRDVVHYTESLKSFEEPECSSIDKSQYDMIFESYDFDRDKEAADEQLSEWLFDAYESVSDISIEDDEDAFLEAFEEWCDVSDVAKDLKAHADFLLKDFTRYRFYSFSRPMLNFSAIELTSDDDKFSALVNMYGEKALFGVWRFIKLNGEFSGNFRHNSINTMCIYDNYGMLCVFLNGTWEPIAKVNNFDLVIPRGTSDEVIMDRCDAVSAAHFDFAKELIGYGPFIESNKDEYEYDNYCASLIYEYSDSSLLATSLLLNVMSGFEDLAANVTPVFFDEQLLDVCVDGSYEEYMYRSEHVSVYFTHIEGRRIKSNEFTFADMYRALNTMDMVRHDEKRDLTEEEAALKSRQEAFTKVLTASLPSYVSVHSFDPWKYPRS